MTNRGSSFVGGTGSFGIAGNMTYIGTSKKYYGASIGGLLVDSSGLEHPIVAGGANTNTSAVESTTTWVLCNGLRVRVTPKRIPSLLTSGSDGWQAVNATPWEPAHLAFKKKVYTNRYSDTYIHEYYNDCVLALNNGFEVTNNVEPMNQQFNIIANADEYYA
jgi:hypothetical protein